MPFTPLHMGPGIVVKALMQKRFSLLVFGWSQILIDVQPLVIILTNEGELHGFSHTLLGATLIGVLSAFTAKPLCEFGLRTLKQTVHLPISWTVTFISAFIGTYSHVAIDSIMHIDVKPLLPLSAASPLHGIISIDSLQVWCVASAFFGALAYGLIRFMQKKG